MRVLLYLFLSFCILSCTSNTVFEKPDDLIPKDTMVMLLQDMYVANSSKYVENKHKQKYKPYIHLVYDTYKIDSLRFTKSNIYYTSRIDEYEQILREVKTNLDTLVKIKSIALIELKKLEDLKFTKKINFIEKIKCEFDSLDTNFLKVKYPFFNNNLVNNLDSIYNDTNINPKVDSLIDKGAKNVIPLEEFNNLHNK